VTPFRVRVHLLEHARTDGWCDECAVPSLWRSYFAIQFGGLWGVSRSAPYCLDCGKAFV
jgi:hypothetical protein